MTFSEVALGTVLKRVERFEGRLDLEEYTFAGTYSFGKGIFVGAKKLGAAFRLPKIQRLLTDDFVYCKIMAWEGAFGVVPPEANGCVVSGAFVVYELDRTRVDPRYLSYCFRAKQIWRRVGRKSTGTNVRRRSLHPDAFQVQTIPLPPLVEQRRIVARIAELAGKLDHARSIRGASTSYAHTLPSLERHRIVSGLANTCGAVVLGELIIEASYGTSVKCSEGRSKHYVPILRIPNVIAGALDLRDLKYAALSAGEQAKARLIPGDLLVVRTNGSADLVGRCAVVGELPEPMGFASYLIRIRCDTRAIDPHYLRTALSDLRSSGALFDLARTTAGQYNVSLGRLRECRFPLPALPEQRRIVAYLDGLQAKVDALETLQEKTAAELDALLPSILDKAFKGDL